VVTDGNPLDLGPAELAARYGSGVLRSRNRFELPVEGWDDDPPRWGVGAFVRRDGRLLMIRQDGRWLLPGGALEPGESHAEGAARETREETGVAVEVTGLAAVSVQTFVRADGADSYELYFATFDAVPAADPSPAADPGLDEEAIEEAAWLEAVPPSTFDRELVVRLFEREDAGER
jgi:ADP-ribose pyrophosphatase YjhB (NUDIX family)